MFIMAESRQNRFKATKVVLHCFWGATLPDTPGKHETGQKTKEKIDNWLKQNYNFSGMKVKNPFGSLEVRGKYGDVAVGSVLRKIQVIKKKSDPTNPKTNAQKSVRDIYGEGVEAYKTIDLTTRDKISLTRFARLYKIKGNPWQIYFLLYSVARKEFPDFPWVHDVRVNTTPSGKMHITCKFPTGRTLKVGLTHKFNLSFTWYSLLELGASGNYQVHISNLMPGVKYYFIFRWVSIPYSPPWTEKITFFQDDFNDGNYNGWTVTAGTWTAVPLYLKSTVDLSTIVTNINVVPPGQKYWLFKFGNWDRGGGAHQVIIEILWLDSNNYLRIHYYNPLAAVNEVAIEERALGVYSKLHANHKYNYYNEYQNWYWVRLYKSGINLKFKIWKDGTTEPANWDWEGTCNPNLIDQGPIMCWATQVGGSGARYDDIEVYHFIYHPSIPEQIRPASGMYFEIMK